MNKNIIDQSIDTIPNTVLSYSGHCSKCPGAVLVKTAKSINLDTLLSP
jgi:hypothetical protein